MIRVLLVDDHPAILEGVRATLESADDITVVSTANDGESARSRVRATEPDVVVMDYGLPDTDGIALTRDLKAAVPGVRVLLLTAIIENRTGATRTLSPIRADLVSGGRLLTRTMIAPPAADLEPGHSRGISMRLPHPGGKMPEVRLSFTDMDVSIR